MKHLIFDIGGVLVYPRLGEWNIPFRAVDILGSRARDIYSARYISASRTASIWLDESRKVDTLEEERRLRGKYIESLNLQMGWHMTTDEIALLADDFTYNAQRYGFFSDVKPWLTQWQKQYSLGLLSDAMPSILIFLQQYGIRHLFNAAVLSTQVGAIKPDARMYHAILNALDARASDCLFVDDRPFNVETACQLGMRGVQMSRAEFPPSLLWDGPVVYSFEELNRLLDSGELT